MSGRVLTRFSLVDSVKWEAYGLILELRSDSTQMRYGLGGMEGTIPQVSDNVR